MSKVLEFEKTFLEVIETGKTQRVKFDHDPLVILLSLAERRLLESPIKGNFIIDITPYESDTEVTLMYH